MAATLNSFLGNLDKIPAYIDECKRLNIEILKPNINKSYTKFTVDNNKIRFGLGSIKNVGTSAIDEIVSERESKGVFKDFADFCERIKDASVNKKCLESLIKAGAFDEFEQTRSTLLASFEGIVDSIADSNKKSFVGQVTMFDLGGENEETLNEMKYNYVILKEFPEKELLSMEKEMLGLYISGHPLENLRSQIERQTTINALEMREININIEEKGYSNHKDGEQVIFAGIITRVKKKFTKTNKIMSFVTVEDLYGSVEVIVFESCYQNCSAILLEDSIVQIDGRLSVREDEETKIVAKDIKEFTAKKKKVLNINVTDLDEGLKNRLKGAIKFFNGEKNNIQIQIENEDKFIIAGEIFLNQNTLQEFQELIGVERVTIKEL